MRLEQVIRSTMTEAADMDGRLDQLVRAGLMPTGSLPLLKRALSRMHAGMSLQGAERDVMNMFINSMMFIVLGDDTVFNKARAGARGYATEEVEELDETATIVAHLQKRYGDNIRKSHVRSAAADFGVDASKLAKAVRTKLGKNMLDEAEDSSVPFEKPYKKVGDRKDEYGNKVKNVAKHLAKKAMNAQKNEEVEAIDELSTATLRSYRAKAKDDAYDAADVDDDRRLRKRSMGSWNAGRKILKRGDALRKEEAELGEEIDADLEAELKATRQTTKSIRGSSRGAMGRAVKKQERNLAQARMDRAARKMGEEVESIDELSKKTLGSYVKKASGAEQPKNVMSPKNVPLTKIAAYQGDSETGHFGKRFNQATYDKAERLRKNRETGIKTAVNKLTKEEVEQVDEISKATMGRYIRRAKDSIDITAYRQGAKGSTSGPLEKKLSKRHKGIETAVKKLTKEDIDVVKKMNESYKTAFQTALNEYGIKSPSELDESKRKEFFNHVDLEFKKGDN